MNLKDKMWFLLVTLLIISSVFVITNYVIVYVKQHEPFAVMFYKDEIPVLSKHICPGTFLPIEIEYEITKIVPVKVTYQMVNESDSVVYRSKTVDFLSKEKYMKFIDNNYYVPSSTEPGIYRLQMVAFYTVNYYREPYVKTIYSEWFEVSNCN